MSLGALLFTANYTTSILAAVLAVYAFPYRESKSIRYLIGMSLAYLFLSYCTVNIIGNGDLASKAFWSRLSFIPLAFVPVSYLIFFSITVSRWRWLQKRWVTATLYAGPVIVTLITLNPSWQDLIISDFQPFDFAGAQVVKYKYGPALAFHLLFGYGSLLAFFALCARVIVKDRGVYRKQAILLGFTMLTTLSVDIFALTTESELDWAMIPTVFYGLNLFAIFYCAFGLDLAHVSSIGRRRVFDLIPDPVLVTDASARVITFNKAAEKAFALRSDADPQPIQQVLRPEYLVSGEQVLPTGEYELKTVPIANRESGPRGQLYFYRDLTEQKAAERKTRELLEFSNEMLSLMSHDLSGNLHVQARLSGRAAQELPGDSRKLGAALEEAATSSRDLVNNLVTWGRSLASGFGLDLIKPYELNVLCEDAIEVLAPIANTRGVRLNLSRGEEPIVLKGDSGVIASVVRNLVSNAIRASSEGQVVEIEVKQGADGATVSVVDQGVGMSEEKLEKIFSGSVEEAQAQRTFGYGIGLRVSQKFLERQNGTIDIRSELGRGTTARLHLK